MVFPILIKQLNRNQACGGKTVAEQRNEYVLCLPPLHFTIYTALHYIYIVFIFLKIASITNNSSSQAIYFAPAVYVFQHAIYHSSCKTFTGCDIKQLIVERWD